MIEGGPETPTGPRPAYRDIDGLVLLDKPSGLSSNRALQRVRRIFAARKGGHTGSLDPLATGMLPICLGQATKISAFLLNAEKVYRFRICFGVQTTTGDAEGPVVGTGPKEVSRDDLERILRSFVGTISQIPPMFSALKVDGKRLYELARAGREVVRMPRSVQIPDLVIESYDPVQPVLRVRCGKGTYIRSLAEDIAKAAGTVGHVAELRRLGVGPFPESAMCTLGELEAAADLERFLVRPDAAIPELPTVHLTESEALKMRRGQPAGRQSDQAGALVRLYDEAGWFLGVGECLTDGLIRPRRLMVRLGTEPQMTPPGCN